MTVTDAALCNKISNFAVTQPAVLSASTTQSNVSCNGGNDGSINLTVTGGTTPYSFSWSTGATAEDIAGLSISTYNVTVTDAQGCTATTGTTITQPVVLSSSTTHVNVSCNGGSDGSVDLTVSGGTTPYSYAWSNGATTEDLNTLTAATYTVTVTDANGCTATANAVVTEPAILAASTTQVNVSCNGGSNGSIDLTPSGGTTPYSYSWSNSATTQDLSGLSIGTYDVTVTDSKGCTVTATATITQPAVLAASTTKVDVSCNGGSDGSIDLTVTGGTTAYSYLWSNGATTQDISGLAIGTYTVTVADALGCTVTTSRAITQPAVLSASTTQVDVSCNGGSDGTIDLTVTGGTTPYAYNWSNSATTQDISGLNAAAYNVTVTDAKNCTVTASVTITEPAVLASSKTQVNVSCNGGSNGSIDVSVSGGTSPYSYNWSNGATTQDISGLTIGTYSVTITDNLGCSTANSATITEPSILTASTTQVNVSCFGGNNASIDLTVAGGTAAYTYSWSNGATTQDISGLTAGTYNVTVTDALGCSITTGATITQPTALSSSIGPVVNVSCNGLSDGSINITISGGTTPYSFIWSTGATTEDISTLVAGAYNVTVTDAQGCTLTTGTTITEPAVLQASGATSHVNVSCNGGSDGSINLEVTGGTTPYSYNWSNGATAEDISGLSVGAYTVTVTDAKSCSFIMSDTITEPAVLAASTTQVNVSCNSGNDGSIDLTVAGGTTPYDYNWSNGAITQDINGLSVGAYTVTVTDSKGCSLTESATITEPALLTASTTQVNVSCFNGNNGSIDLTVAGGTVAYTYIWSTGAITQDISGLIAGSYSVTVTDAQGCTLTESATITEPALLIASASHVNVSCFGGNDGSIDLTVAGGTTPYSYAWSNLATTQDIATLIAGTYDVTVTDALGCSVTASATITQPAVLTASATQVNVSCNGEDDGSVDLTVSGGTTSYSYNWNNGESTQDISGLVAAAYSVTVTDAQGCSVTASATITEPAVLAASTTHVDVSCNGGNNGSIDLAVAGGTTPYSYNWNNGETSEDIDSLAIGTYSVTATDAQGCSTTTSATITQPPLLTASSTQVNVSCSGGNNGSIDLTVAGGTTPYAFSWSNGATTEDISGLTIGTYTVTVTDAMNCTVTEVATIIQPALLTASTTQVNVSCFGGSDGTIDLSVAGGTPSYTYSWNAGSTAQDIGGLAIGTYIVTVTDAQSCTVTTSATITQPPVLDGSETHVDVSCRGGDDGSIDITITGGTPPYIYDWSTGDTTQDISGLTAGSYSVTVTDAEDCAITSTISINEPTLLTASSTQINVSCFGGNDASIDLTVNGGTTPYSYNWSYGATTQDIDTLSIGTYTVTVTDAQGCNLTRSVIITQPLLLTASATKIDVSCFGFSDGSIDLTVAGGTTPYNFNWSNSATTEDVDSLFAGAFTVTVTDAKNCTVSVSATVGQPAGMSSSTTQVNVSCNGGNDGSIDLTISGGTTPYTYLWSNSETTQDITTLSAGTFDVTVTDANGCSIADNAVITEPATLTASNTKIDVSCFSGNDGSVDLSIVGGTMPYTYSWSNGATTEDISGMVIGTYSVTVTDAKNCSTTSSAIISQPTLLTASTTKVDVSCFGGNTGSIDLTVTGGTTPYTFNWSNSETTEDLDSLTIGTYIITVTDAKNCTVSVSTTITEPAVLAASHTFVPVSCNGGTDGSVDVTVTGGTTAYDFIWTTGDTTEDLSGLIAGTYGLTVTDAQGCVTTLLAVVSEASPINISLVSQINVLCKNGNNASLDISVSGGTPPYVYVWSNGATTQDISTLTAGNYSVTVTDANNCDKVEGYTITEPTQLASSTVVTDVSCNGFNTGSIDISVSGGTLPYVYAWSNGATTQDINSIVAGNYSVTVTDVNNCSITLSNTVNEPTLLVVGETHIDLVCNNIPNGAIDVTVSGGVAPYTYNWSNGATTQDLNGLTIGTYTVTVTDANSCTSIKAITLVQPSTLALTTSFEPAMCGVNDGVARVFASGGTPAYTYLWSTGATSDTITGLGGGAYNVTVTDANSCSKVTVVSVRAFPATTISIASTDVSCNGGSDGEAIATITSGTAPFTFNWVPTGGTDSIAVGLAAGTYSIEVYDSVGCNTAEAVIINEPAPYSLSVAVVDVSCSGGNDGEINLNVSGNTAPYTFNWSNGATTEDLTGLAVGSYDVTISDVNNCSTTTGATITQPNALTSSLSIVDVNCNGGNDGAIDVTVNGGTFPYDFLWNTGDTTEDISGLVAGTYNVTITDAQNCSHTKTATVNEPVALAIAFTQQDALCKGSADGSIDITVSGGVTAYTYLWSTGGNSEDISGLIAGSYTVTVTDAQLCTATQNVSITEPTLLNSTLTQVNVSCNGGNDGSVDLTVNGGTTPYTYLWSNGAITQDIDSLIAANYSVTVTDANNCSVTDGSAITQPTGMNSSVTKIDVSCNGGSDGSIDLTVSGGTLPYTYTWSTGATIQDISGLTIGNYSVTITDAQNCVLNDGATIIEPAALAENVFTTNVSCNGGNDGSIDLTVSGGTPPYTYTWSTGATTEDISGLTIGSYNVTVTDAQNCTLTSGATITEPTLLSASTTKTDVSCNGGNNGSIDLTLSGGSTPYTILWSSGSTSEDIFGLIAGSYSVTITDAQNCTVSASELIGQPSALAVSLVQTDASCNNASDGSIDLTVSGGTPGYTFLWSNGATTEDISGLTIGSYTVTVTDNNACTISTSTTIVEPDALASTVVKVDVTCSGNSDGSIDLTITGGTTPYTFIWSNGATTEDLGGLTIGSYNVTVTDIKGCGITAGATITEPATLSATISKVDVSCNGFSDGSIDLTVTGGTFPYSYSWTTGDTIQDLNSLVIGSYSVTVTDAQNCPASAGATITQPTVLAATLTKVDASCNAAADGSVDLTVSGGTAPYAYIWTSGAVTEDIDSLVSGSYTVTVTDAQNCTVSAGTSVAEPNALSVTFTKIDVSCNGSADGSIDVTVAGGTTPYSFLWSNGAITEDLSGLVIGTYSVTVTDAQGCSDARSVTIVQPALLTAVLSKDDVNCNAGNDGSIDLTVSGGTTPYTFAWSNGATTEDLSGLVAASYSVTITDAQNCTVTRSASILEPAVLAATLVKTDVSCFGGNNGAINLTVSGGTASYSFLWSNGATTEDISGISEGSYSVTVTDAMACSATDAIVIGTPDSISVSFAVTNTTCNGGKNGAVDATVTGGTSPYTYQWNFGATTQDISGVGAFSYTLTVTDANSCQKVKSVTVGEAQVIVITQVSVTPVSCNGGNTGAIDISASGGQPPYTYVWSNGAITEDASGLTIGSKSVTVTDAAGCTKTRSFNITQPTAITITTTSVTPVSCNGGTNGAINITVSGGMPGYTFLWSNGATTEDATGLSAASYTVTVTDANLCTATKNITVTQPTALTLSFNPTHLLCNGNNNGAINITVSGGTPGYSYIWSNGATTEDISGLTSGVYSVTVTDANACSVVNGSSVNQPAQVAISITKTDVACNGASTGAIDATISGGTPPYRYSWSNGATTEDISALVSGSYSLTVMDENNCQATVSAFINQSSVLSATLVKTDVSCNGGATGAIDITVSGGNSPYTFVWSNGATTEDISSLIIGSYSVTITDATNCTITNNTSIVEPTVLAVTGSVSQALCAASTTGSIDLTVNGGTTPYTILWSTGVITEDISNVSAGNYSVTVTDAQACSEIKSFTIGEPASLTISVTNIKDATCNGTANGTITISVSGGTPAYTYLWSNGATTATVSNLASGSYSVTVTDANSCSRTRNYNIGQPSAVAVNASGISNALCNGSASGSITLTVSGGTAPYTYLWNNGATTQNLTGLISGSYSVTVTDAQNCTDTDNYNVAEPTVLAVTISAAQDVSCNAAANGAIDITVTGGTLPYSFIWSNGATTEDITGLSAGSYTVTVTDANSCARTVTHNISQPAVLAVAVNGVSNALCYGQPSGSIDISVNGGTTPYTFIWSNGATTEDISNVTAGNYTVTVTDARFCSKTASYAVGQPSATMTISVTGISDAKCFGSATGFININVNGGTPAYTYLWSNGATTKNVASLAAGSYSVTITDANGCKKVGNYNIGQPAAIAITTVSVNDAVCYAQNGGSIDISVSGGTPAFTYSWSNGTNNQDISGVLAGSYTVTVTDANSCTQTNNFSIAQPTDIGITLADSTNVSCNGGNNGAIDITVVGGTPSFTYAWSNGAITQDISGISAGTYTVTITDSKNCFKHGTFNISQPDVISISVAAISDASCNGQASGNIDITVTGGVQPYLYSWSNGADTEDVSNLLAGSYRVTVADANGCIESASYNIGEPTALAVNAASITDALCQGDSTGTISVVSQGGTPPYTFSWSTGTSTPNIINVVAGGYTVTVTDAQGCAGVETYQVLEPDQLAVQVIDVIDARCNAGSDGEVKVSVSGGTPPYLFKWSNTANTPNITELVAGRYTLTVTDAHNCNAETSADVREATALAVLVTEVTDAACFGGSNGSIDITVRGGNPPYTYNWSNGATTEDISGVVAGSYTVSVSDANVCAGVKAITVSQAEIISANASIVVEATCTEMEDGRIELQVTGGTPPYSYLWSTGETETVLSDISKGSFSVTITDVNGCTGTNTFTLNSSTCNRPPVAVDDTVGATGDDLTDIPVMNNDYDPDNDNITVTGIVNPPSNGTVTINSDGTITYTPKPGYEGPDAFTYIICDDGQPEALCDTATVFITVKPNRPDLYIPNAISPNNDESNEFWEIRGIGLYPHSEVVIFNRWGNEVYRMNSYNNQWNGVNQDREPLPDGTYYYILKLNDKDQSTYTGYVVIFRG